MEEKWKMMKWLTAYIEAIKYSWEKRRQHQEEIKKEEEEYEEWMRKSLEEKIADIRTEEEIRVERTQKRKASSLARNKSWKTWREGSREKDEDETNKKDDTRRKRENDYEDKTNDDDDTMIGENDDNENKRESDFKRTSNGEKENEEMRNLKNIQEETRRRKREWEKTHSDGGDQVQTEEADITDQATILCDIGTHASAGCGMARDVDKDDGSSTPTSADQSPDITDQNATLDGVVGSLARDGDTHHEDEELPGELSTGQERTRTSRREEPPSPSFLTARIRYEFEKEMQDLETGTMVDSEEEEEKTKDMMCTEWC